MNADVGLKVRRDIPNPEQKGRVSGTPTVRLVEPPPLLLIDVGGRTQLLLTPKKKVEYCNNYCSML